MRIISQNGTCDIPYEMTTLWVCDNKIIASPIGEPEKEAVMAQYSTSEKVEKVMQTLHKIYVENLNDLDQIKKYIKAGVFHEDSLGCTYMKNKHIVFCFPTEDEL